MKRVSVATLLFLLGLAGEARAQVLDEAPPPREPDIEGLTAQAFTPEQVKEELRRDTALVVSGGVSLGSYQAGFLYYFLEYMKRRRMAERAVDAGLPGSPFSVATGASAGSINASLAAMESCRKPQPDPTQSVFYQTWIPVGIDELYPTGGKSVTRESLFTRKPIDDAALRLKEYVNNPAGWLDAACDVDIGMVTTRLEGRAVKLRTDRPSLEASRMTEKFALQFHKPANQHGGFRQLVPQASLSNPEVKAMSEFLLRPGHHPERVEFSTFAKLLKASSSFPLAFEPVQVPYQVPGAGRATDDFIDGGVFENVPVRLATRVLDLQELAKHGTRTRPRNMNYVVVDSDVLSWQRREKAAQKGDGLLSLLQAFAGDFVGAASSTELLSAIEEEPELRGEKGGLIMAERRSMLASDHLYAFSGFFDKRFRLLDFYLGMLDARHFARQPYWLESDKTRSGDSLVPGVDASIRSEIFRCFVKLDEASDAMDAPVGLERAAKLCNLGPSGAQAKNENTEELRQLAILFDAAISVKNFATSRRSDGKEAEFDRWLGHLDDSDFKFRVFGEDIEPADFKLWLRERVGGMLDQLASKQPENGFVISDGGSVALNGLLHYVEPLSIWGFGVHLNRGLDVEYGYGRQYRFGIAARLRYFSAIKALQGEEVTATPFAAATFAWIHRVRLVCGQCGLELGADLGAGYRWLSRGAETEEFGADPGGRDHPEGFVMAAGPAVTLTFLQRAYARLDNHYFWSLKQLDLGHPAVTFGMGLGWRFH